MKGVRIGDATCFLTAHLSAADGNELDIFIDNTSGTPLAVSASVIEGTVSEGAYPIVALFEPAPADERPEGEVTGCSHFVAKTPFLLPGKKYIVKVSVSLAAGAAPSEVVWDAFVPQKFAHHVE